MKKTIFLILLLLPAIASAQAFTKIKSTIVSEPDYYKWLTSLSVGPIKSVEMSQDDYENAGPEVIDARWYRVAVATSEIYSTVYVEEITSGTEGCCVKLRSIQELDLYDLKNKFNLTGESTGFQVLGWDNFNTFKFTIHSKKFKAVIKGLDNIEIALLGS